MYSPPKETPLQPSHLIQFRFRFRFTSATSSLNDVIRLKCSSWTITRSRFSVRFVSKVVVFSVGGPSSKTTTTIIDSLLGYKVVVTHDAPIATHKRVQKSHGRKSK